MAEARAYVEDGFKPSEKPKSASSEISDIPDESPECIDLMIAQYYRLYDDSGESRLYAYTDGSTTDNGRRGATGGYAVFYSDRTIPYVKAVAMPQHGKVTNGVCELLAIIAALEYLCTVDRKTTIYYDSTYAADVTTGAKKAHTNLKLVNRAKELYAECRDYVQLKHVKAHTGNMDLHSIGNRIADHLAGEARPL